MSIIKNQNNRLYRRTNKIERFQVASNGLLLSAGNEAVNLGNPPALQFDTSADFSLACIVRLNSFNPSGGDSFFSNRGAGTDQGIMFSYNGDLLLRIGDLNGNRKQVGSTLNLVAGQTYFFGVSKKGTDLANWLIFMSVFGAEVKQLTSAVFLNDTYNSTGIVPNNWYIGRKQGSFPTLTRGVFFASYILNRTSNLAEMKDLARGRKPSSGLVAAYEYKHKQGTVLTDLSGNGINGTLEDYTPAETSLGASNKWVDFWGNPLLS